MQGGHDYVPVKPLAPSRPETPLAPHSLPSDSTLNAGPTSLPARPAWVIPPADEPLSGPTPTDLAKMVESNSSIVANRKALRMANLSAADMIKAELAAPPLDNKKNLSAAEKLKRELKGEVFDMDTGADGKTEEAESAAVELEEEAPHGIKRKIEEIEEVVAEEEDAEDGVDAFLSSAVATPVAVPAQAPLKQMGNGVVEQEDTVK